MAGVNKAIILGNLGQDPEHRTTSTGMSVARLSVATSRVWMDKATGDKREETEWHRVTAWGKTADLCSQYLAKGRKVYIEGRIKTSKYEADGVTKYSTEIVADRVVFCDSGQRGSNDAGQGAPGGGTDPTGAPWPSEDEIPF